MAGKSLAAKTWGNWLQVQAQGWKCTVCFTHNAEEDTQFCISCEAPRSSANPKGAPPAKRANLNKTPVVPKKSAPAAATSSFNFGVAAPAGGAAPVSKFSFGLAAPAASAAPAAPAAASTFVFGLAPAAAAAPAPAAAAAAAPSTFKFGLTAAAAPPAAEAQPTRSKRAREEEVPEVDEKEAPVEQFSFDFPAMVRSADFGGAAMTVDGVVPPTSTARAASGDASPSSSGVAFSWGSGDCEQLGHGRKDVEDDDGDVENMEPIPRAIQYVDGLCHIAAGGLHNAAVSASGEVYTWGCNDDEALGRTIPDAKERIRALYAAHAPEKLADGDAGIDTLLAKYDRHEDLLYMRLQKKYGAYPGGECVPGLVLGALAGLRVVQVECGDSHTAALTADGRVFAWGTYRDNIGYLGFDVKGTKKKQETPIEVKGMEKLYPIKRITCGSHHTSALSASGEIMNWGDGEHGQLGRTVLRRHKKKGLLVHPVTFKNCAAGLKTKKQCAAASVFSCGYRSFAILRNGMVFAWGLNNYGQLGVGDYENRFRPALVEGLEGCVQIDGGIHHSLALTSDGSVFGFGRGDSGQIALASGPRPGITLPTRIPSVAATAGSVVSIGCGTNHSLALSRSGKLFVWGFGEMQQLGNGACSDEHFPIEVAIPGGGVPLLVRGGGQHSVMIARR